MDEELTAQPGDICRKISRLSSTDLIKSAFEPNALVGHVNLRDAAAIQTTYMEMCEQLIMKIKNNIECPTCWSGNFFRKSPLFSC